MDVKGSSRAGSWLLCLLVLQLAAGSSLGQRPRPAADFFDDKLPIPDAEQFDTAEYIESGVGLSFGVDKRLSYNIGQYQEAARRFEQAIGQFKFKSEIWVYLARAYFYNQEPEKAKRVLEQAAEVMPDLKDRLWQPLIDSLLEEIRRRANQLRVQVEFYSQSQEDFLSLFRLYRFLQDQQQAAGVIRTAEKRVSEMSELAGMAAGATRKSYLAEAGKWQQLADRLRAELDPTSAGTAAPLAADTTAADSLEQAEIIRLLQLRVDFYQAKPHEYQALFDLYLRRGQREQATGVVQALEREAQRAALEVTIASTAQEGNKYQEKAEELGKLREQLQRQLDTGGE